MRYAAAILLLMVCGGSLYYVFREKKNTTLVDTAASATDILPGADKAILTLSNGKKIILDSTTAGSITEQDFRDCA